MDISFIDNELKKKIEATKFVFLVARAGTGKTFSGDYLECVRGWKHVDGDIPYKNMMANPQWKAATERMYGFGEFEGKVDMQEGLLEDQKHYFECVARLTLEATRDSDKVVVSHDTYTIDTRDFFRQLLVDAGAKDLSSVFLYTNPDNHARAIWDHLNRQAKDSGFPLSVVLKLWQADGIKDFENFQTWFREESPIYTMFEEAEDSEQPYLIVDNTAKDVTVLNQLDEVFGIKKNTSRGDGTYDEMIQKIKDIDTKRDMVLYEVWNEVIENDTSEDAKTELEMAKREPQKLAARRSSLLDAHKVENFRRLSRRSSTDGSLLLTGSRHSSYIILGKFIDDVLDVVR